MPGLCPEPTALYGSAICWWLPAPVSQARPAPSAPPGCPQTHLFKTPCPTFLPVAGCVPTSVSPLLSAPRHAIAVALSQHLRQDGEVSSNEGTSLVLS